MLPQGSGVKFVFQMLLQESGVKFVSPMLIVTDPFTE
jgi:hypothetical protein